MDAAEFSIAMHLIQKHMQGNALPTTLPLGMLPMIGGAVGMPSGALRARAAFQCAAWCAAFAAPTPIYNPTPTYGAPVPTRPPARPITTPTPTLTGSAQFDWSMDEHDRRKWGQLFNQLDRCVVD